MNVVYVTGSEQKAKLFNTALGIDLPHERVDVAEIQSLDASEVVTHKAYEAFRVLKRPILVEDTTFVLNAFGNFPGPLIKWMLAEVGSEGLSKIAAAYDNFTAVAGSTIAYYDGEVLEIFSKELIGTVALKPRGSNGWGFDTIFISGKSGKTHAELNDEAYLEAYKKVKPFEELRAFLQKLEKSQA